MVILVGETDGDTTFTLDEPVVAETVEQIALRGILHIGYLLCILGHCRAGKHGEAECESNTFLHS